GLVTVAGAIDRETAGVYNIIVRATSTDASFRTKEFTISIGDVDEFAVTVPTDASPSVNAVDENAANGTLVGITANATDGDATNSAITWSLIDDAGGRFTVDPITGIVTVADGTLLDRESSATHDITVRGTSADGSSADRVFSIAVNDVNEFAVSVPVDMNATKDAVNENAANGTLVGITATASDSDATTNIITWSLADTAGGRFAIDPVTGTVRVANGTLLDREAAAAHNITVRATSADGSFADRTFTIAIEDLDEFDVTAPTDSNGTLDAVDENAATGTIVGITAIASDSDATTNQIRWTLTDDAGGRFMIDSVTGVVTVADGTLLDREAAAAHIITVRATSEDNSFAESNLTIAVNDVDEFDVVAVTDSNAAANSLPENSSAGTTVGLTAFAADADATTNGITYSLSNNDGGRFTIDAATGVVTLSGTVDLETDGNVRAIVIRATSQDGSFFEQSFSISITNVNEAPAFSVAGLMSVPENSVSGTAAGAVSAIDVDAGDVLTYSIDGGTPGQPFSVDAATGMIRVASPTLLDFEQTTTFAISVRVTDAAGLSDTQTVMIHVSDVNETPVSLSLTGSTVAENSASGTGVGTVSGTDADAGDVLSYSLVDSAGGRFAIDSTTGGLSVSGSLNYESQSSHSITVRTTDTGGLVLDRSFVITVTDINDPPVAVDDSFSGGQMAELVLPSGSLQMNDTDEDGDILTVQLVTGPTHGSLTLQADGSFRYMPDGIYSGMDSFQYLVRDGHATGTIATVRLEVRVTLSGGSPGGSDTDSGGNSSEDSSNSDKPNENSLPPVGTGPGGNTDNSGSTRDDTGQADSSSGPDDGPQSTTGPPRETINQITTGIPAVFDWQNDIAEVFNIALILPSQDVDTTRSVRERPLPDQKPNHESGIDHHNTFGQRINLRSFSDSFLATNAAWNVVPVEEVSDQDSFNWLPRGSRAVTGVTAFVSSSLTVGYVVWLLRGGSLLTAFLSSLPAWKTFDPLPILEAQEEFNANDEDESLLSMVSKSSDRAETSTSPVRTWPGQLPDEQTGTEPVDDGDDDDIESRR
ncbi:MAG: cadherin domain-containing protein, partial [Planctomycetaceae bacterium]|nr:cadherin domain-containing protein [Planctomycetaceae bacterium]